MDLLDMFGAEEANIIEKETISRSNTIETENLYEKQIISLLKENENFVT